MQEKGKQTRSRMKNQRRTRQGRRASLSGLQNITWCFRVREVRRAPRHEEYQMLYLIVQKRDTPNTITAAINNEQGSIGTIQHLSGKIELCICKTRESTPSILCTVQLQNLMLLRKPFRGGMTHPPFDIPLQILLQFLIFMLRSNCLSYFIVLEWIFRRMSSLTDA